MKNRLTTLDIVYLLADLRQKLVGMRIDQVYDVDKKTYLIRLVKPGVKIVLLLESGTRLHTTSFLWPKNPAPSGFSMKLRKHLNNKRLEKIQQVGADRIIDLQFGTDTVAHHILLELYDKGNIILTDNNYTILSLLRPRIQGEERLAAHENYAVDKAKSNFSLNRSEIEEILKSATNGTLRELFLSKVEFGPSLFSHALNSVALTPQTKINTLINTEENFGATLEKLFTAFELGRKMLENVHNTGGIIVKQAPVSKKEGSLLTDSVDGRDGPVFYDQFHPSVLKETFEPEKIIDFESFDEAIDEFFSKVESQKMDMKQLQQETDAIKKLAKVKLDQQKRLEELQLGQEVEKKKATLITMNQVQVDMAISAIRKLVASQVSWDLIDEQLKEARAIKDPLATMITKLSLKQNSITLNLSDPYDKEEGSLNIDVDLNLSAFANATKYFDLKKASAKKEERTLESQVKAFKSSEKKTMATLKEASTIHSIKKARKVLWFEKFRWFISSEGYLILGGRDAQQNELLVKKYIRPTDVYLHADSHGAPTIIIKNDVPAVPVMPKTLNEAGCFALSTSGSWESKVVTSIWWVFGDQVSKSAPTGLNLPTGSFMIRGKKNYLPPCQLVLGFGFLFRLTEESMEGHKNERSRRNVNEDSSQLEETNDREEELLDDQFPDTQVDMKIDGDKARTRLTSYGENGQVNQEDNEEFFVTTAPLTSINSSVQKLKNKQKKAGKLEKNQLKQKKTEKVQVPVIQEETDNTQRPKRGQHGRNKKLKEKYKFQDDEERLLRMQLLRTGQITAPESGAASSECTKSDISEPEDAEDGESKLQELEVDETVEDATAEEQLENLGDETDEQQTEDVVEDKNEEADIEQDDVQESELDLLKSLTGTPFPNDELLMAVGVIAPYSTLQNYKFRIKLTPGQTKRGKAAKMALESFLRDKDASPREKDLIKAVKDQDLARNFPGKVKVSNIIRDKK